MNRKARRLLKSARKRKSDRLGAGAFETIDAMMGRAVALHREGKLDDALSCYGEILELYPDHPDALSNSALVIRRLGDADRSLRRLRRAVELAPESADGHSNLGSVLEADGILDEAEVSLRRALALDPDLGEARVNLGNVFQKLGKFDDAAAAFRDALAREPDNAVTHSNLGNALKSLGQYDAAMTHLRKAVEIDPSFVAALNNMAIVLHEQGKLREAVETFRKAVALQPDLANTHYNLGCALTELGESEAAIYAFRDCLLVNPNHANACLNLQNLLLDEGRQREAVPILKQAVAQFPSNPTVSANLANLLSDGDDLGEALESALRALWLDPNSNYAKCSVAKTLIERGSYAEAVPFYDDLPPAANEYDIVAHGWLCNSLLRHEQTQAASLLLDGLLKDAPLVPKQRHDLFVKKAIHAWLADDLTGCRAAVTDAVAVSENAGIGAVHRNALVFERYVLALLEYRERHPELYASDTREELHLVGESHSLSPHGTIVEVGGMPFRFASHLIVGCKAWHLADPTANYFQRAFTAIVRGLPDNSNVLLTMGEIDCRPDEGIYPLHRKKRIDPAQLIDNTVTGFVDFVVEAAAKRNLHVNFCGVPAPHRDRFSRLPLPAEEAGDYLDLVARFNQKLGQTSTDRGCGFLDLHRMSVGDDGTADGRFHIDDTHLLPHALHQCLVEESNAADQASARPRDAGLGEADSPPAAAAI